jgi:hypothetical protein
MRGYSMLRMRPPVAMHQETFEAIQRFNSLKRAKVANLLAQHMRGTGKKAALEALNKIIAFFDGMSDAESNRYFKQPNAYSHLMPSLLAILKGVRKEIMGITDGDNLTISDVLGMFDAIVEKDYNGYSKPWWNPSSWFG